MHFRGRLVAGSAVAVIAATALGTLPSSATQASPRTAKIASVEQVDRQPLVSSHTVVYAATAVQRTGTGGQADVAITCAADSPAYFLSPSVRDITVLCWLRDEAGRRYDAPDQTTGTGGSASAATATFTVPADRSHSVCMSVQVWGKGEFGPTRCERIA